MNLFQGRPLAAGAVAFVLCAVLGAVYPRLWAFISVFVVLSVLLSLTFLSYRRGKIGRYRAFSSVAVVLLTLLFAVRCTFFFYFDRQSALRFCGEGREVCGIVEERVFSSQYSVGYDVTICFADGEKCSIRSRLVCSYPSTLGEGDLFVISDAEIRDGAESSSSFLSDGIYLSVYADDQDDERCAGNRQAVFSGFAAKTLNRRLSSVLERRVGGEEGKLCAAMLLRGAQPSAKTSLDFRRSGVSHLLAVSGLHMSVLSGFAGRFLAFCRVPKRARGLVCLALIGAYVVVLGFPVSAVRSALMLAAVTVGGLFGFDADGVSSLSAAVCVILAVSPGAVCDAGFILSATATLGMITLMPEYNGRAFKVIARKKKDGEKWPARKISERVLTAVPAAGVTVIAANMMTAIPCALIFGEISRASPVANLIFPPAAAGALLCSLASLLLSFSPYLSGMFSFYAGRCASFIIKGTACISDIRGAAVSLRGAIPLAAVLAGGLLTAVLLCVRLKRKWAVPLPYLVSLSLVVSGVIPSGDGRVRVADNRSGTSEALYAVCDGSCAVIDLSAGNYSPIGSAASGAASFGACETEALILTHYHVRHISSVSRYMEENKLRQLWIPEPETKKDASIALRVAETAGEHGVPCRIYRSFEELTLFGGITLRLSGPLRIERSTHPVLTAEFSDGERTLLWLGRSSWESERIASGICVGPATSVIKGLHGPVVKSRCSVDMSVAAHLFLYSAEELMNIFPDGISDKETVRRSDVSVHTGGIMYVFG